MHKLYITFIVAVFCFFYVKGQDIALLESLHELNFTTFNAQVETLDNTDTLKKSILILGQLLENNGQKKTKDSLAISTLKLGKTDKVIAINHLANGFYYLKYESETPKSYISFENAIELSKKIELSIIEEIALTGILEYYFLQKTQNSTRTTGYIKRLGILANTLQDSVIASYYETNFNGLSIYHGEQFHVSSKALVKLQNKTTLSSNWKGKVYDILTAYFRDTKELDSLEKYAQRILDLPDTHYTVEAKYYALLESAASKALQNDKEQAYFFLSKSRKYIKPPDSIRKRYAYNRFAAMKVLAPLGEYEEAYYNLEQSNFNEAALNFKENKEKINELKVQLETAEKEKKLLLSEKSNKQNRNIAIGLGGGLLGLLLISVLLYKNTKRKQRIAEQERELEIQKKEKILKEQELTTIDAMISGQEKERQRLASDLHDSVGATLAAAKLQFHHLSKNRDKGEQTEELFTKTGKLLEDAYTEIRTMAHVKNSGVIAKNGLLPAVQKLAKNASGINGLHIEVEDFGLDERLENSLEISVFRIIQELVTNIIKHSHATEASIAINQYKDSLNIIVEDNGKGFKLRTLSQKNGMGLSGIEKRIEHLEGTLEVDSTPGKGTHILIDIPL